MAQDKSYIKSFLETIRDERGTRMNTATRIGTAFLMLLEYVEELIESLRSYVREHLPDGESLPYLRRDRDDTAEGVITFEKGVVANGEVGVDVKRDGVIGRALSVYERIRSRVIESFNFEGGLWGSGWQLTDDDGSGSSRLVVDKLVVRKKMTAMELEVRKYASIGGNLIVSPANGAIEQVDYVMRRFDQEGNVVSNEVLGYEYVKVPWTLRLIPLSLRGKFLGRLRLVRTARLVDSQGVEHGWEDVNVFRCWFRADDGTTRTRNSWQTGMLARCQTFDIDETTLDGTHVDTQTQAPQNKYYWRAVVGSGQGRLVIDDGHLHSYAELANYTDHNGVRLYDQGSNRPEAGDNVVCFGDWKNPELSHVLALESVSDAAPCFSEYVGIGYTDGTTIDWSLEGKQQTRISPKAGNKFVAPSFLVQTNNGEIDLAQFVVENGHIMAAVKSALGQTGIDIDQKTVELRGNKVRFTNTAGDESGKVWIDPTDGSLHAVDGHFGGTVKADIFYRRLSVGAGGHEWKRTLDDGSVVLDEYNEYDGHTIVPGDAEPTDGTRTVQTVEYYGNADTDIFYMKGGTLYLPDPVAEGNEGRMIEIYNAGDDLVLTTVCPEYSDPFTWPLKSSTPGNLSCGDASYLRLYCGLSPRNSHKTWIILEWRMSDGRLYS